MVTFTVTPGSEITDADKNDMKRLKMLHYYNEGMVTPLYPLSMIDDLAARTGSWFTRGYDGNKLACFMYHSSLENTPVWYGSINVLENRPEGATDAQMDRIQADLDMCKAFLTEYGVTAAEVVQYSQIFTDIDYRGQGLSKEMWQTTLLHNKEQGFKRSILWWWPTQQYLTYTNNLMNQVKTSIPCRCLIADEADRYVHTMELTDANINLA